MFRFCVGKYFANLLYCYFRAKEMPNLLGLVVFVTVLNSDSDMGQAWTFSALGRINIGCVASCDSCPKNCLISLMLNPATYFYA